MKGKILPYSISVGIWNAIFTVIVAFLVTMILSIHVTWELFFKGYICGYVFLWIGNLRAIDKIE